MKLVNKEFTPHPAQLEVFYDQLLDEESSNYNIGGYADLEGALDQDKLIEAVESLQDAFDIHRIGFEFNGMEPKCFLKDDHYQVEVRQMDLSSFADAESRAMSWMQGRFNTAFRIGDNPLYEFALIKIAAEKHKLFVRYHHVITDAYGFTVALKYIAKKYSDLVEGIASGSSQPEYFDEIRKANNYLKTARFENDMNYWVEMIQPLPEPILKKQAKQGNKKQKSGSIIYTLSDEQRKRYHRLAKCLGVNNILHLIVTALQIYFGRIRTEKQFIFGLDAYKRRKEQWNVFGLFAGILPFSIEFDKDDTVAGLVEKIKKQLIRNYRHQNVTVSQLSRNLNLKQRGRDQLFEVVVNYLLLDFEVEFKGLRSRVCDIRSEYVKIPLMLWWRDYGDRHPLELRVDYNKNYIDTAEVELLMERLFFMIDQFEADPDKRVSDIGINTPKDISFIEANNASASESSGLTVIRCFEEQVAKNPKGLAVVSNGCELTYGELDEKASALGSYLKETYGIKPNDLIALMIDNSEWAIIAMLGIMKAGAAYVPVDAYLPESRQRFILEDTGAKALIIHSDHLFKVLGFEVPAFSIDIQLDELLKSADARKVSVEAAPDDLAYVIYTSGTTGQPKGVMVSNRNVVDYYTGLQQKVDMESDRSFGLMSSLTADLGNTVLFGALLGGGTLHTFSRDLLMNAEALHAYFGENRVDCIKIVPSHWRALTIDENPLLPGRTIIFGGEILPPGIIGELKPFAGQLRVFNHYGPTETTIGKLIFPVDLSIDYCSVPIGKPFSETSIRIVDRDLNVLPPGVPGELLIGGKGVAAGYLNRETLTAQRFIYLPADSKESDKYYRTGDLVKWLPDGNVQYIGRTDDQVKIRGYRVEPGEVTTALSSYKELAQCAVLALRDETGNNKLVAYVVPAKGFDQESAKNYLSSKVPDYMIPAIWISLDRLPLNANGKIDRNTLPKPGEIKTVDEGYIAPSGELQNKIATIWKQLLNIDRIGINDNFFELGGDSIVAIQLVSKVKRIGFNVQVQDLFDQPTIRSFCTFLENDASEGLVVDQRELSGISRLTPIQKWFFEEPHRAIHHYNQAVLLNISKDVNEDELEMAFQAIFKKHDALRFYYTKPQNSKQKAASTGWKQTYGELKTKLETIELDGEDDLVEGIETACTEYQQTLRINEGETTRFVLMRTPETENHNRLLLVAHHLVMDGISWRILLDDLDVALKQLKKGQLIDLGLKTSSYQDWAETLTAFAGSEQVSDQLDYWEKAAAGYQPLPVDKPAKAVFMESVDSVRIRLDKKRTKSLLSTANSAYNTEINDLLLSALAKTIASWTERDRVTIGLEGHGREPVSDKIDISQTMGWFTSKYPVTLELPASDQYGNLIKSVKEQLRNIPDKGIGYGCLKYLNEAVSKQKVLSGNHWDIVFNYLGQLDNMFESSRFFSAATENTGAYNSPVNPMRYKLEIIGTITGGQLSLQMNFSGEQYERASIEYLASRMEQNLIDLIEHCSNKLNTEYTPSDYRLNGLIGYEELDEFLSGFRQDEINDIYKLSALQEGILFHSLLDDNTPAYITQLSFEVHSELDVDAFRKAWEHVIQKRSVLRTGFVYDRLSEPVQCVFKKCSLPFEIKDFRGLSVSEAEARFNELVQNDRLRGFSLDRPPLLRITLVRFGPRKHKMIWTKHHIIWDGWSDQVIINEVLEIYQQYTGGRKPLFADEDRYGDYINFLQSRDVFQERAFWSDYLAGISESSLLPFVGKESGRNQGTGSTKKITLAFDEAFSQKISDYTQSLKITNNTFIQGVWALLLSRYTANEDVIFGVTVAGRPPEETYKHKVGLFINTIPLKISVAPNMYTEDWFAALQKNHVATNKHQYTPLKRIQTWSGLDGDFFDSILVIRNYPTTHPLYSKKDILDIQNVRVSESNNYLLSIEVSFTPVVNIDFKFNSSLLLPEYAEVIKTQFEFVVRQFVEDRKKQISEIRWLAEGQEKQLLQDFNPVKQSYPENKGVVDLFKTQVGKTPERTALIFGENRLTYRELDQRSDVFAHYLKQRKVGFNDLIGVCLDRSPEMLIALLGIMKTGNAYVPLDPKYPADRISYIVENSAIRHMVTSASLQGNFKSFSDLDIVLVEQAGNGANNNCFGLNSVNAELAYVIYTSGSTGRPKGVMVRQSGLVNFLTGMQQVFNFNSDSGILALTTFSFDIAYLELYLPLITGGRVIMATADEASDAYELQKLIELHQPSHMQATPATWQLLVDTGWKNREKVVVMTGGEAISESLKEALTSISKEKVWNLYGPTETTIWSTVRELKAGEPVTIGKPILNTRIYITDRYGSLCPVGVPGELCIGGAGLAKGYLNRPDLSEEKFINNPFVENSSEKIYRTGDLARWLPDGNIEYLGRMDNQVKVRGYRIELGEIEAVLSESDLVKQCAVKAIEDGYGSKQLAAYIIPREQMDRVAIKQYLKSKLPEYMIPALWVEMKLFPLTPNGKLDRQALPDPDPMVDTQTDYEEPVKELDTRLARIWSKVLGLEKIGIDDNFFELGGHSLLATRVLARIRKTLQVDVNLKDLFTKPTIRELSTFIERSQEAYLLPPVSKQRANYEKVPLSFAQERLWFLDQFSGSTEYHIPYILEFDDRLDIITLESCLRSTVERYEVLRTVFRKNEEGTPYQLVIPAKDWQMDKADDERFDDPDFLQNYIDAQINEPFDLARDYMFRANLVEKPTGSYVLVITVHHIASDAWSNATLVNDFIERYRAVQAGIVYRPGPLPVQYTDYAIWQKKYLTERYLEVSLNWWKEELTGLEPLNLPTDFNRPSVQSKKGNSITFQLDNTVLKSLGGNASPTGASLYMHLLAAFKVLLYRYSGQKDICIGTPYANRDQKDLEELAGFFVNTLAIRTKVNPNEHFSELLNKVKTNVLSAFVHKEIPFEKVVNALEANRDLSRSPVFQAMFVMQNTPPVPDMDLGNVHAKRVEPTAHSSLFDLTFFVHENPEGGVLRIEYCADLFQEATIRQMGLHFQRILKIVANSPNQVIGKIGMLSHQEKQRLLVGFNDTSADFSHFAPVGSVQTVHTLFEQQVQKTPHKTALVFKDIELTYQELSNRIEQLAWIISQQNGFEKGDAIAVMTERSEWSVIAMMAVLKLGGIYVPVDPAYPQARLTYIIEDSRSRILLKNKGLHEGLFEEQFDCIVDLEDTLPVIPHHSCPETEIEGTDLSFVIYTSGSTGKPKGVAQTHRMLYNLICWDMAKSGLKGGRKHLQFSSFCFDSSLHDVYFALSTGGEIHVLEEDLRRDFRDLGRYVIERRIATISMPYAALKVFFEAWQDLGDEKHNIDEIISTGEQLYITGGLRHFLRKYPAVRIFNFYGPSETHVITAKNYCFGEGEVPEEASIGKPLSNTEIYIFDDQMELVPVGIEGEIYAGGYNLARGYTGNDEETAARFVENPFIKGNVIYKTGDMGKWLPNGDIAYKGRRDDQVKINGYRIEPGAIEAVILQSGLVRQTVVIAQNGPDNEKRLLAYVVGDMEYDKVDLMQYLQAHLPNYMAPAVIVELEKMPLNSNGKFDKKQLSERKVKISPSAVYTEPRNKTESLLSGIWQELLQTEKVGIYDNFFELGGHSLLAVKAASAIHRELHINLPIKVLFQFTCIADLADYLLVTGNFADEMNEDQYEVIDL